MRLYKWHTMLLVIQTENVEQLPNSEVLNCNICVVVTVHVIVIHHFRRNLRYTIGLICLLVVMNPTQNISIIIYDWSMAELNSDCVDSLLDPWIKMPPVRSTIPITRANLFRKVRKKNEYNSLANRQKNNYLAHATLLTLMLWYNL
jgi:hypothetical protein